MVMVLMVLVLSGVLVGFAAAGARFSVGRSNEWYGQRSFLNGCCSFVWYARQGDDCLRDATNCVREGEEKSSTAA